MTGSARRARLTIRARLVVAIVVGAVVLSGCASAYGRGANALRDGRYDEAATQFQEILAREPERVDALVGLGVARYRLGAYHEAAEDLERAVEQAPRHAGAQLYLGLAYLRRNEIAQAQPHLTAYRDLAAGTRAAAQVDRAVKLLGAAPAGDEVRGFVADALEEAAETEHELAMTRAQLRHAELWRHFYWDRPYIVRPRRHL